jgi:hypothetical protein
MSDDTQRQRLAAITNAAAADDVKRAVEAILRHNGYGTDRGPIALEIHAAYVGRGWQPPAPPGPERCDEHPGIQLQNGVCAACGPKED